jgi:hypothetical protein
MTLLKTTAAAAPIILTLLGIIVAFDQITTIFEAPETGNLMFVYNDRNTEDLIGFTLFNNNDAKVLVRDITMTADNFIPLGDDQCTYAMGAPLEPSRFDYLVINPTISSVISHTLTSQSTVAVIELDEDEIDVFTVDYETPEGSSYSFDVGFEIRWCDLDDCTVPNTTTTDRYKVTSLTLCQ